MAEQELEQAMNNGTSASAPKEITAECLCIGDELLIGQTINTNAAWMGQELGLIGIRTVLARVVGDDRERILEALHTSTADIVLITGGLGPTKDDITKHTLCTYFDTRLVRNAAVEAHVVELFTRMGRDPRQVMTADLGQAMLPEACTPLVNERGTASGMWFEKEGRVFISMPGVPYEMQAMMKGEVLGRLRKQFHPPVIVHRTIRITGMGETQLAQHLEAWENGLGADRISLAYLPSPGLVKLRLSTYAGGDQAEALSRVDLQVRKLYKLIPEQIYGEGRQRLEEVVGEMRKWRTQTLVLS